MSITKKAAPVVKEIVEQVRQGESKRFKRKELNLLFHALLLDKSHRAQLLTYNIKAGEKKVEETVYAEAFENFLDTVFAHAKIKPEERKDLIASYVPKTKDVSFFIDLTQEAQYQLIEAGSSVQIFAEKEIKISLKKSLRKGKFEGIETYSRKAENREYSLKKAAEKAKALKGK
jgi:hypothetical protein